MDHIGSVIDSVHSVPRLIPVRVEIDQFAALRLNMFGEPDGILLPPNAPRPHLSLIHEIGHLIDMAAEGSPDEFCSIADARWSSWRAAVLQTPEVQNLATLSMHWNAEVRKLARYNYGQHEVWARSYAQYIAMVTGDPTILQELAQFMAEDTAIGILVPRQWSDANFAVIGDAIDDLFRTLGWI